jgi:hypothetical protein
MSNPLDFEALSALRQQFVNKLRQKLSDDISLNVSVDTIQEGTFIVTCRLYSHKANTNVYVTRKIYIIELLIAKFDVYQQIAEDIAIEFGKALFLKGDSK